MRHAIPWPGEKITLRLSAQDWSDLTTQTFIDPELTRSAVSDGQNWCISWSVAEIRAVVDYLAEGASYATDREIAQRLDHILGKIDLLLNPGIHPRGRPPSGSPG